MEAAPYPKDLGEIEVTQEISLRSREERRWQEERVRRLMREMKDIEAVHLEKNKMEDL